MALNEDILAMNVSHSIGLRRLENANQRQLLRFYTTQLRALEDRLRGGYPSAGPYTKKKLNQLKKIVRKQIPIIKKRTMRMVAKANLDIARYEIRYQNELYESAIKSNLTRGLSAGVQLQPNFITPDVAQIRSALMNNSFQGSTLNEWFSSLSTRAQTSLNRQLAQSIFQGETIRGLNSRLKQFRLGNTRQVTAVSRTAFNHAINQAKELQAKENNLPRKRYTAILDFRTTVICATLDGTTYEASDNSAPDIPQHIGCRSTYVYFVAESDITATDRRAIFDDRTSKRITQDLQKQARENGTSLRIERRNWAEASIGKVSGRTNFPQFFRNSPENLQKAYLGESRFRLYKTGRLDLKNFINQTTGRRYNLAELRRFDKEAFRLAGL